MLDLTQFVVMSLVHVAWSGDTARMLRMEGQVSAEMQSSGTPITSLDSDFGADLGTALGQTSESREPWDDGHESQNQQKHAFPAPKLPGDDATGSSLGAAAAAVVAAAGLAGVEPSVPKKVSHPLTNAPSHAVKLPAYHVGEKVADYVAQITGKKADTHAKQAMGQITARQPQQQQNSSHSSSSSQRAPQSQIQALPPWDPTKVFPTSSQRCFGKTGGCVTNGGFDLQVGRNPSPDITKVPWSWKGYPDNYIHLVRGQIPTTDDGYYAQLHTGAVLKHIITKLKPGHTYQVSLQAACSTICGSTESLSIDVGSSISIQAVALVKNQFEPLTFTFVATQRDMSLRFTSGDGKPIRYAGVNTVPDTSVCIDQVQIEEVIPQAPSPPSDHTSKQSCSTVECCRSQCAAEGYCCNEDITKSKEGQLSCLQACMLKVMGYDHDEFCPDLHCHDLTDPRCLYNVHEWRFPILNLFAGCGPGGGKGKGGQCIHNSGSDHDSGCKFGMRTGKFNPETTQESMTRLISHVGVHHFGESCEHECPTPGSCDFCGPQGVCCSQMGDFGCDNYLKDLQHLVPEDLPPIEAETVGSRCVPESSLPVTKLHPSRLTCQQLNWTQFMGRVPIQYTAADRGVAATTNGLHNHNDHDDNSGVSVTPQKIQDELGDFAITKCPAPQEFAQAVRYCADAGARLCTAKELQMDVAKGTGCDMDRQRVWSATSCDYGRRFLTLAGAHEYSKSMDGHQCTDPGGKFGVRCCCDEEENRCGLNQMSMDAVVKKCGVLPHACMFLINSGPDTSCGSYCKRHNLECLGSWLPTVNDEFEETCTPSGNLGCNATRTSVGDPGHHIICECDVPASVGGVPSKLYGAHYGRKADCTTDAETASTNGTQTQSTNGTQIQRINGTNGTRGQSINGSQVSQNGTSIIALASTGRTRAGKSGRPHANLMAGQTFQEEETDEQLEQELNEGLDGSDVGTGESDDDYYYNRGVN